MNDWPNDDNMMIRNQYKWHNIIWWHDIIYVYDMMINDIRRWQSNVSVNDKSIEEITLMYRTKPYLRAIFLFMEICPWLWQGCDFFVRALWIGWPSVIYHLCWHVLSCDGHVYVMLYIFQIQYIRMYVPPCKYYTLRTCIHIVLLCIVIHESCAGKCPVHLTCCVWCTILTNVRTYIAWLSIYACTREYSVRYVG
jgi:hypothetical protein